MTNKQYFSVIEAANKYTVDERTYSAVLQEAETAYHELVNSQLGEPVALTALVEKVRETGTQDVDYYPVLVDAVFAGDIESSSETDVRTRDVWFHPDVQAPPWSQIKPEENSLNATKTAHLALPELQPSLDVIAVRDTGELYACTDGVWAETGKQRLREQLSRYLGDDYSKGVLNAAEELIKANWNVPQAEFGVPAGTLPLQNGLLDIHTRDLTPISPDDYITTQMPIPYDPEAGCPTWHDVLDRGIPESVKQRKLQEFVGYLFWPSVPYKKGLMLFGDTDTGKSTLIRALEQLFRPEDLAHVPPKTLQNRKHAPANLQHSMVNIVDELDDHQLGRTDEIKKAISGDPMEANPKYKQPYRFSPTCKHLFASNKALEAPMSDTGFWNRWVTIVFEEQIPKSEQIPKDDLLEELSAEAPGILNWALDGLTRLHDQNGFTSPRTPEETHNLWATFGNDIQSFMDLCIAETSGGPIPAAEVYEHYQRFCAVTGRDCDLTQGQLTGELNELDIGEYTHFWHDGESTTGFENITLQYDFDAESGDDNYEI